MRRSTHKKKKLEQAFPLAVGSVVVFVENGGCPDVLFILVRQARGTLGLGRIVRLDHKAARPKGQPDITARKTKNADLVIWRSPLLIVDEAFASPPTDALLSFELRDP